MNMPIEAEAESCQGISMGDSRNACIALDADENDADAMQQARHSRKSLAWISHEMRTPLNAILGYVQLLQKDQQLSDVQTQRLATIEASGQHLLGLVSDIVDLAGIDAGQPVLCPTPTDVSASVQGVADLLRVGASQKSLRFVCRIAAGVPASISVDDKRLRQVLLNLGSNALKYTDTGQVSLRVVTVPAGDAPVSRVRLRFEVEDSGIGMSDDQLLRIFRPFEQVADLPRRQGGVGLGLAISRQLVRLMGSDIQVRSTSGQGSVFWFELDLPVGGSADETTGSLANTGGQDESRKAMLAVDDRLVLQGTAEAAAGESVVPPPEEIEVLGQLTRMGNMRDIRKRADHLKGLDPRYVPFAELIDTLARGYQSRALAALVERVRATTGSSMSHFCLSTN